jgi:2-polyprenyl-3-methyl-5-hydroxy-6-metoxy-1,4-benzoquinol methylase
VTCLLCGAAAGRRIGYPGAESVGARELELGAIAVCGKCGFGRAEPCPDQPRLDRFYASGSYWHGSHNPYQMAHERVQAFVRVRRCMLLLPPGGALRVLDVGAGHGFIAEALERVGRVAAYDFIEPDDAAARYIAQRERAFPRNRLVRLADGGRYDVLFLNHVLEHVADPAAFLQATLPQLKAGALAYVETPLADQRFKRDVFPHVLFFTPDAVRALGQRLGVATLAVEAFGRMHVESGRQIARKLADAAFQLTVRSGVHSLQTLIDHAIWSYRVQPDGVWLRWLFRPASPKE